MPKDSIASLIVSTLIILGVSSIALSFLVSIVLRSVFPFTVFVPLGGIMIGAGLAIDEHKDELISYMEKK